MILSRAGRVTLALALVFCTAGVVLGFYPLTGRATTVSPATWLIGSVGAAFLLKLWTWTTPR